MLLRIANLVTGYGRKQVINGISLSVNKGEIVALIGHNGAGKSTILKAILKIVPIWSGDIFLDDVSLGQIERYDLVRAGIVYSPQGNRVFGGLTVRENLEIAGTTLDVQTAQRRIDETLDLLPVLKNKLSVLASTLSGGEAQILSLGNALVPKPKILLLDEPSLGLAPPIVTTALHLVQKVCTETGTAALIVEQKVRETLKIAQSVCVLRSGKISYFGPAESLNNDAKLREVYL